MFGGKGFTMGLMAGALMGAAMGSMVDPMKSKSKKIRKNAGDIIHTVGDIVDGSANN